MPFTISHTGRLGDVLSAAEKSGEAQHIALGKNKAAEASQNLFGKFVKALREALSDFPDESDAGLVLVGDAGPNHLTITNMQLTAAKPKEEVNAQQNAASQPPAVSRQTASTGTQSNSSTPAGVAPNSGAALNDNKATNTPPKSAGGF